MPLGGGGMHVPVHGDGGGRAELPAGLLMGGGRVVVVIKEGGEELGERDVLEVADDGRAVFHTHNVVAAAGVVVAGGAGVPVPQDPKQRRVLPLARRQKLRRLLRSRHVLVLVLFLIAPSQRGE